MKITVPAERVRRPPKLRSPELSRGRRPDATSAAATLAALVILFDIVPRFSTMPRFFSLKTSSSPPVFFLRNEILAKIGEEESLSLTLPVSLVRGRRDERSAKRFDLERVPAGSRRTSARLPRDHRVPCKIFGLEDGQSGAEPRVESEVDARAQQVLHYVRIRCYTPPHSLIQSNGQPLFPLVQQAFSLSFFLFLSPYLPAVAYHTMSLARESIDARRKERSKALRHHYHGALTGRRDEDERRKNERERR